MILALGLIRKHPVAVLNCTFSNYQGYILVNSYFPLLGLKYDASPQIQKFNESLLRFTCKILSNNDSGVNNVISQKSGLCVFIMSHTHLE